MLTWWILDYNGKHRLVNLLGVMTWHYITDKRNTCYHREISFTDLRWCVLILCDVGSCAAVTSHQLNLCILCVFSAYSLLLICYFSRSLCSVYLSILSYKTKTSSTQYCCYCWYNVQNLISIRFMCWLWDESMYLWFWTLWQHLIDFHSNLWWELQTQQSF